VLNIERMQRRVFLIVPLTAVFTLLIAATLGLVITRSITSHWRDWWKAPRHWRGANFNIKWRSAGKMNSLTSGRSSMIAPAPARSLRDSAEQRRSAPRVIDTIPAHAWSTLPDGSVDFINKRFLEFTGLSLEDLMGWGWGSVVHPDDSRGMSTSGTQRWRLGNRWRVKHGCGGRTGIIGGC